MSADFELYGIQLRRGGNGASEQADVNHPGAADGDDETASGK